MRLIIVTALALVLILPCVAMSQTKTSTHSSSTYSKDEMSSAMEGFFEDSSKDIAELMDRLFKEYGEPNAYIKGEEAGGALVAGLRYGQGTLTMKSAGSRPIYWQGPSIGFDIGANASKVFALVYRLPAIDRIFQRHAGVEGGAYVLGGLSVQTVKNDEVIVSMARTGMGLRLGANLGSIHFTPQKDINPF